MAAHRARGEGRRPTVVNGKYQYEDARQAMQRLLRRGAKPSGVVSANTPMAIGALRALDEAGLQVPHDVAIVSCEDVPSAEFFVPSISVIGPDLDAYGAAAVDLLVKLMAGEGTVAEIMVPHSLVVRESSRHE